MQKLFFVIATLTTLVKSEDVVEWICEDINQMGNCSTVPDIPQLLQMMEDDSKTNKYSDKYYCPYNIVKRNAKCIHSYFLSCYDHMTIEEKLIFAKNLPKIDESSFCAADRAYKKEFKEHMVCIKMVVQSIDQLEVPFKEFQQYLGQRLLEYEMKKQEELESDQIKEILERHFTNDQLKCQNVKDFMQFRYLQMRSMCGTKTEKFFRQLFGNIWPLSTIPKKCDKDLYS